MAKHIDMTPKTIKTQCKETGPKTIEVPYKVIQSGTKTIEVQYEEIVIGGQHIEVGVKAAKKTE